MSAACARAFISSTVLILKRSTTSPSYRVRKLDGADVACTSDRKAVFCRRGMPQILSMMASRSFVSGQLEVVEWAGRNGSVWTDVRKGDVSSVGTATEVDSKVANKSRFRNEQAMLAQRHSTLHMGVERYEALRAEVWFVCVSCFTNNVGLSRAQASREPRELEGKWLTWWGLLGGMLRMPRMPTGGCLPQSYDETSRHKKQAVSPSLDQLEWW